MSNDSTGFVYSGVSLASAAGAVVMEGGQTIAQSMVQDVTQTGQIISIIVSIVSGVVSLWKLLKRKK